VVFYYFLIVLLIDLLIRLPWIVPDFFYCNLYLRHLLGLSEVRFPHKDRQLFSSSNVPEIIALTKGSYSAAVPFRNLHFGIISDAQIH